MNVFETFTRHVREAVATLSTNGVLPGDLPTDRISVDPPRDPNHGDLATNAAMVLAKLAGKPPRDVAQLLVDQLINLDAVETAEIAGPGFINLRISAEFWRARLLDVIDRGTDFGSSTIGQGQKVNVEYVSANPTGPLHVAHARGAVFGDALYRILKKAGFDATAEYYTNDAGAQVETLARSTHLRYREALGHNIGTIPEGMYPGDYLKEVGKAIAQRDGDKWLDEPESVWLEEFRAFAVDQMMAMIRDDLAAIGIEFDVFASERALVVAGAVDAVMETLTGRGLIYTGVLEPPKGKAPPDDWEPRPQTLFKATDFGDDTDRPLKKSDGSWTYFANDIAYHLDKYRRGFPTLVNVFGADHGGYVKRMNAAVAAVTDNKADLDIKLCQMVRLVKDGEPFRMSKRAGTFVTLRDLTDEVGGDVVRFLMLTRKNDSQMEFDLTKAVEQSRENPVFYVQYAHARCRSVLRAAAADYPGLDLTTDGLKAAPISRLEDAQEIDLMKLMAQWPRVVEGAATAHEPHRVPFYLHDLASAFHAYWNRGNDDATLRVLVEDDAAGTHARLALVHGVATVIRSGLEVLGVTPAEELR